MQTPSEQGCLNGYPSDTHFTRESEVESGSPIVSLREIWPLVVFFIFFITVSAFVIIFGEPCDNCGI